MFDNLRNDVNSGPFYEDDKTGAGRDPSLLNSAAGTATPDVRQKSTKLFGMTAQQRFIIAFMMMIAVCVLGIMLLLITGRFGLY